MRRTYLMMIYNHFARAACLILLFISFKTSAQFDPDFKTGEELYEEAMQLFYQEENQQAIDLFDQINENDSLYADACGNKAVCLSRLEKSAKALEFAKLALELDPYDARKYDLLGEIYELEEDYKNSKLVYKEALNYFPVNQQFMCNLGTAAYELGEEKEAFELFKKSNDISLIRGLPNYFLADLCHKEDLPTQGYLAMLTHLALNPESFNSFTALTYLEDISDGALGDPGRVGEKVVPREFEELDVLFRNKVAFSSKFKTPSKFDFAFVKQGYLILSQITENPPEGDNYWTKTYVPIYQEVMKREDFDLLMLLVMASSDNGAIQKELKKNKQKVIDFKNWFSGRLAEQNKDLKTDIPGEDKTYNKIYHDNGQIRGLGEIRNDQLEGTWHLYDESGALSIIGNFMDGNAHGEWNYYNEEGLASKMLTFKNNQVHGPYEIYHENGALKESGNYNEEEIEGKVEGFGRSGVLENVENFDSGKREGEAIYYFVNGNPEYKFSYKENRLEGKLVEYYPTGEEYSISNIVEGQRQGKTITKYLNGNTIEEKNYKDGDLEGPYLSWYPDGTPKSVGKAAKNSIAGEWKEYYENGVISEKSFFGENGKLSGTKEFYNENGELYEISTYSKGNLTQVQYFDNSGKEVHNAKLKGGNIYSKYFDHLLQIKSEGLYENGEREGDWKFYNNGQLAEIEPYKAGLLNGQNITYYPDGKTRSIFNYEEDKLNGKYISYNRFGQVYYQGFYRNGLREGLYQSFYADGTPSSELYYNKGKQVGTAKYFAPNGKLDFTYTFDNKGDLVNYTSYDTLERPTDEINLEFGKAYYELKYPTGEKYTHGTYINSELNGEREWYYPDGSVRTKGSYFNDERMGEWSTVDPSGIKLSEISYYNGDVHGTLKEYYYNGNKEIEGTYHRGNEEGMYTRYYEDGSKRSESEFVGGELHGKAIYYNLDGNVLMIRYYDRGRMTAYSYNGENNKEVDPIPIENETGKITAYYPNGNKSFEYSIENGWFVDDYYQYHEDGSILQESFFEKDLHAKPRKTYWKNGKLRSVYNYKLGELNGLCVRYNENGSKMLEHNYMSGELHGWTHIYDANGKKKFSLLYYNGSMIAMN